MNDLQHISYTKHGPVLVTLNPLFEHGPAKTFGRWKYDHPVLISAVRTPLPVSWLHGEGLL